jgi:hypothetical protein
MIKHHPNNRAERLKLKEIHETEKRKAAANRRRLKEELRQQEIELEIKEYGSFRETETLAEK